MECRVNVALKDQGRGGKSGLRSRSWNQEAWMDRTGIWEVNSAGHGDRLGVGVRKRKDQ